jgi:hypothetical protein
LECQEKCKKSFNSLRVKEKKEAEPVLKKETQVKANIAVSKPLTWVMKPKPKITEEKKPIIILAPMKLVPKRPMEKRTAKIMTEGKKSKPWIKRERKPRSPSLIRPKNDQDAIPWSKVEHVKELTKEEYEELVKQREEKFKEDLEIFYQEECERELRKQRNKEYLEMKEFLEFLKGIGNDQLREFLIETWIFRHRSDTIGGIMALKNHKREEDEKALEHHGKTLSRKEMNKLKHALNRNTTPMQAACIAIAASALTYLVRRSRPVLLEPVFTGEAITGARYHTAAPTVAEITDKRTGIDVAAAAVGRNVADLIAEMQAQQRTFQERLATEQ